MITENHRTIYSIAEEKKHSLDYNYGKILIRLTELTESAKAMREAAQKLDTEVFILQFKTELNEQRKR